MRRLPFACAALLFLAGAAKADPSLLMLDTHLDSGEHFGRAGWDILKRHSFADDLSQLDYPRMVEGGLDGGFFDIYTPQGPLTEAGYRGARNWALLRGAHIREMVAAHPGQFALALKADDALSLHAQGKKIVFISMENSYPIGTDLSMVETFYRLGVRMAGPVHFGVNQLGDSATDTRRWHGLSPLGKRWVAEMNRLGMIIDASHSSDDVFDQLLALSRAPIVLSHSGSKTIFDHPRNLDDARVAKLAAAGGVIQVNSVYLVAMTHSPARDAIGDRMEVIDQLSEADQARLIADHQVLDAAEPAKRAGFDQFMQALLHAITVAGIDHVGIGADWDGGGGVTGMEDIADLPKVTAALRQAGYSDADIAKIWSGNTLRVMRAVEAEAEMEARH